MIMKLRPGASQKDESTYLYFPRESEKLEFQMRIIMLSSVHWHFYVLGFIIYKLCCRQNETIPVIFEPCTKFDKCACFKIFHDYFYKEVTVPRSCAFLVVHTTCHFGISPSAQK